MSYYYDGKIHSVQEEFLRPTASLGKAGPPYKSAGKLIAGFQPNRSSVLAASTAL